MTIPAPFEQAGASLHLPAGRQSAPLHLQLQALFEMLYEGALKAAPNLLGKPLAGLAPSHAMAMLYSTVLWAFLVDTSSVMRLVPLPLEQTLEVVAALWVILARRGLKRASAKAADPGHIHDKGFYRLIRHPVSAGRTVLFATVLFSNFNLHNMAILISILLAQLFMIAKEEETLMQRAAYRHYAARVPYRLIYGIY